MTAPNNPILANAAYNGYLAGASSGRYLTDPTAAGFTPIVTAAQAFSEQVDSLIPTDPLLVSPCDQYTIAHSDLLQQLCAGTTGGAVNQESTPVPTDYATNAAAIVAAYNASTVGLQ